jgi:hypothetical protein
MNNETSIEGSLPPESLDEAKSSGSSEHLSTESPHLQSGKSRSEWMEWVRQGLRASVLRPVRELPGGPTARQMLLIVAICVLTEIALDRAAVSGEVEFSFTSWLYQWVTTGIGICGVWLLVNWRSTESLHTSPVAAWFLLGAIAGLPVSVAYVALRIAVGTDSDLWTRSWLLTWGIYLLACGWSLSAGWRIARGIHRSKIVAVGIMFVMLVLIGLKATILNFPVWHADYSARSDDDDNREYLKLSQEVFESQQSLLNDALRAIKPHEGAHRQVYALIYAPYSQDVFLRESSMVQEVLEQSFGAKDRIVRLVNHAKVTSEVPWATNQNLERSLTALGKAMDLERDVLVLYLTSHGGKDFVLATQHYPLEVESLKGSQLRQFLENSGIRNRVIIISACYSGGWIDMLSSDNTLVMTAADKEHTSYGCGNKSDLTYFGRAIFDEQLRKNPSFEDAFNTAVPIIRERETEAKKEDGFSNPQMSVGKKIKSVLEEWAEQRAGEKHAIP